jgi:hypothetical protein
VPRNYLTVAAVLAAFAPLGAQVPVAGGGAGVVSQHDLAQVCTAGSFGNRWGEGRCIEGGQQREAVLGLVQC